MKLVSFSIIIFPLLTTLCLCVVNSYITLSKKIKKGLFAWINERKMMHFIQTCLSFEANACLEAYFCLFCSVRSKNKLKMKGVNIAREIRRNLSFIALTQYKGGNAREKKRGLRKLQQSRE